MKKKENAIKAEKNESLSELRLQKLGLRMIEKLRQNEHFEPIVYEMYNDYYFKSLSNEEMSNKYNMNEEQVIRTIGKVNKRLLALVSIVTDKKNKHLHLRRTKEYDELKAKFLEQQQFISSLGELKKSFESLEMFKPETRIKIWANEEDKKEFYLREFKEFDLPTRLLNCLKAVEIETIGDILKFRRGDFLKFRNFGYKSFVILEAFMIENGLEFKGENK